MPTSSSALQPACGHNRSTSRTRASGAPSALKLPSGERSDSSFSHTAPRPSARARPGSARSGVAHTLEPVDNEAAGPLAADSIRRRVNLYGCQRDEQTGSTYYQFLDGQQRDVVGWYESDWSLRRKAAFVGDHKLAGLAFFAGGGDGYRLTRTYHALRTATPDAAVPDPAPC